MSDETVDEAVVIDEGIVLEARVQQSADRVGGSSVIQRAGRTKSSCITVRAGVHLVGLQLVRIDAGEGAVQRA